MNPAPVTVKAIEHDGEGLICLTDQNFKNLSKNFKSIMRYSVQCKAVMEFYQDKTPIAK